MTGRKINLIGNTYARLTVIEYAGSRRNGTGKRCYTWWKCECVCGNIVDVRAETLKRPTISCGCFKKEVMAAVQRKCWSITPEVRAHYEHRYLTINGQTGRLGYWSKHSGISVGTIYQRLKRGWDVYSAVFKPV